MSLAIHEVFDRLRKVLGPLVAIAAANVAAFQTMTWQEYGVVLLFTFLFLAFFLSPALHADLDATMYNEDYRRWRRRAAWVALTLIVLIPVTSALFFFAKVNSPRFVSHWLRNNASHHFSTLSSHIDECSVVFSSPPLVPETAYLTIQPTPAKTGTPLQTAKAVKVDFILRQALAQYSLAGLSYSLFFFMTIAMFTLRGIDAIALRLGAQQVTLGNNPPPTAS